MRVRRPNSRWKHGSIPVVGLIGGMGSGKSAVAAMFGARGAHVLDADAVGHALLDQSPSRERVVARFGADISQTDVDGRETINRAALGAIVFADAKARRELESVLHPRMRRTFEQAIRRVTRKRSAKAIVLDAAILLEADWDDLCDVIVFVDAPEALRHERLRLARGWSDEAIRLRERAQGALEPKRRAADVVVVNDGDLASLESRIAPLWRTWTRRERRASGAGRARGVSGGGDRPPPSD